MSFPLIRSTLIPRQARADVFRAACYYELFGTTLRDDVISETGGDYGKLLKYALASPEVFFSDMIDWATEGLGCSGAR